MFQVTNEMRAMANSPNLNTNQQDEVLEQSGTEEEEDPAGLLSNTVSEGELPLSVPADRGNLSMIEENQVILRQNRSDYQTAVKLRYSALKLIKNGIKWLLQYKT